MSDTRPVIEAAQLCKGFAAGSAGGRVAALQDISFSLGPQQVLGIVGKSGAGKTTLLRLLSLQMPPDSGRLRLAGIEIGPETPTAQQREVMRRTATVFQGFSLLYNRNVLENVALPLKLRGTGRAERHARAREMLDFVGLADRAAGWPITLSGGEAQRVAIARALITAPEVLFLDEPTSALDAETGRDILDLLRQVQARYRVAMVLVAHHMEVVRYMCDHVLHLEGGRIRRLGPITRSDSFRIDPIEGLWQGAAHV